MVAEQGVKGIVRRGASAHVYEENSKTISSTAAVFVRVQNESAQLREQIGAIESWALSATNPAVREFRLTSVRHLRMKGDALEKRVQNLDAIRQDEKSMSEAERLLDEVRGVQLSAQTIRAAS